MLKIGIMGGTFDPIHFGHLVTAESARCRYGLDKVIFVPSGNPPHKKERQITESAHRMKMCLLATATNGFFEVSPIEAERPGYSYAYDTVCAFGELYGEGSQLFFITGADAIMEILTWKNVGLLMEKCRFIAASRPGFRLDLSNVLEERFLSRVEFLEVPALAISSSDIRRRVRAGESIKYLLPEAAEAYIFENPLYQEKE
ncbi:MAG: nicotinate-nucleotide adenylyltransferase [Clostridiales bacterium]|nr:nicotinate-nucleotide adenylyltransferase [Clostridiales bacterium]